MPPRIVTISDHVDCPTGFGVQHRHLAFALAHAGFEVHALGLWDTRPLARISAQAPATMSQPPCHSEPAESLARAKRGQPFRGADQRHKASCVGGANSPERCFDKLSMTERGHVSFAETTPELVAVTRYPAGLGVEDHRRAWPMYRELLRPDLVITLGDFEMFRHLNDESPRNFAWCHWLPIDALPYPDRDHAAMLRYDHLVLMSRFGLGVVRPHLEGRVPLHYIPHGVDVRAFRPHDDPLALRRRWSRRLGVELRPDDFVLIARDTNQWRKQQPLLLEALAMLPRDVKLLLHCAPVAHPRANGWDLPHLARLYGVADRAIFTAGPFGVLPSGSPHPAPASEGAAEGTLAEARTPNLTPEELAELDNLSDLRVSATAGEGFGVVTIEAMACGTPTLITNYATSSELLLGIAPGGSPFAGSSPPAHSAQHPTPREAILDRFGPAGELLRVAAWTVEQARHLFRPVPDATDLAARVLALRDDRGRLARYGVAGLRRVLAHYTLGRVATDWAALARRVLAERVR
ncbi:MAG TPA: glycosyltransferase family 4 protein [Planctomycetota bacterium]|nr:glycosyltransferase family 4 protein [Planctomycetota bacterium]